MIHQNRVLKQEITTEKLKEYFPNGALKTYAKGYAISYIHKKVRTFRWLLEGSIAYYIPTDNPDKDVLVCQNSEPFSTLGLNGFTTPKRYIYKVLIASQKAVFFEIPFEAVSEDYSFTIKIEDYAPYSCGAVHDGHQFRKSLWENCLHTE